MSKIQGITCYQNESKKRNIFLFTITQKGDETLHEYNDRFTNALSTISYLDSGIALYAYTMD